MILSVSDISVSFDAKQILQDVSFHIEAREKAALIGINGAGKTTLFHVLLGDVIPDQGETYVARNIRMGYLP